MSLPFESYSKIKVETYLDAKTRKVRVRPVEGEMYPPETSVECSRSARYEYPVGTKFLIHAKLTDRAGSAPFLYSHHSWPMIVIA